MRASLFAGLVAGSLVCLAQGPCAAQPDTRPDQGQPQTPDQRSDQGQLQTPDRYGSANLPNAATAPLHDLNVVRQGIPPILLEAISDPYARPSPLNCHVIAVELGSLDLAMGADFDAPNTPQNPSLTMKNRNVALALIHGAAENLLPFSGFVRTLSGAQRHDELVIEAIAAGSARRGYLKGLGEATRCPPPAAPTHFRRPRPPALENGREPQYPIH
jgi:hypothetical protein